MLRSEAWLSGHDVSGLLHRASLRAGGAGPPFDGRPVVGICNSWSQFVHCNVHFRGLAHAVAQGVLEAGGVPVEFPTISLSENLMKPTAMMFRNLMAMDVEEMIRSHPIDVVVLIGGCDKTIPAQLMGAISAGVPAIALPGGPREPATFDGRELGVGTDLWHYTDELRSGRLSLEDYERLEQALMPSHGHCNEMGTASTMAALLEGLGVALPGAAAVPAVHGERARLARLTGIRAVELPAEGLHLHDIVDDAAVENAITLLMALGGATNAVVHLIAIAGRLGRSLPLERFAEISRRTPQLVNVRPTGQHLMNDVFRAGGIPAVLDALRPLLHLDAQTVTGRRLGDAIATAKSAAPEVIGSLKHPHGEPGAITVLRGNLAPHGAIIKRAAASAELLEHAGPAIVFDGIDDLLARIEDPDLPVTRYSVLVLRGAGPVGGPGMPEWGMLPVPSKLLRAGVTDLVRVSDARMSGTAYGTVVLHVAPEAAIGGPLARLRDGDIVRLGTDDGLIEARVDPAEWEQRPCWQPRRDAPRRGYGQLYHRHVLQVDRGCDFDFLLAGDEPPAQTVPTGILRGFIGGW